MFLDTLRVLAYEAGEASLEAADLKLRRVRTKPRPSRAEASDNTCAVFLHACPVGDAMATAGSR